MDIARTFGLLDEAARKEIDSIFEYQPWDEEQEAAGKEVREALAVAFKKIVQHVHPSADRSAALRCVREARLWANSAITFKGRV